MTGSSGDERVDTADAWGKPDPGSDESALADDEATLADAQARLDRSESLVEEQQETIQALRERVADLEECWAGEDGAVTGLRLNRRTALKTGGLWALFGVGAGTASADPQGQVGTNDVPIETLYTEGLAGPLTDDTRLASLTGAVLTVSNGELALANKASGGDDSILPDRG